MVTIQHCATLRIELRIARRMDDPRTKLRANQNSKRQPQAGVPEQHKALAIMFVK
jgi:hypothetical protein